MRRFRLFCLIVAVASWLDPRVDAADGAGTIRFITPRRFATLVGPSTATLDVVPPPGATIASVAFVADGVPSGTTSSPPWMFAWEAGDGTAEHKLDAVAKFSDGTEARASLTSGRRIVTENVDVMPVTVYAIARGVKGAYVDDLGTNDVRRYEDGRLQVVEHIAIERKPLRIAIVVDTSLSMEGDKLKAAVASAVAALRLLQPRDEGLVVGFSDKVSILQDWTSDRRKLESAIRSVAAGGGSSLYDAIYDASGRLASFDGRRVLWLLADGRDEAANGRDVGSVHTLEQARERALRNDVMVFAIGLGKYLAHDAEALAKNPASRAIVLDVDRRQPLASIISSVATATGGSVVFAPYADQLRPSFERFAEDLRHQYRLSYLSSDTKRDGAWREVKVDVDRPGASLTSRKGYFAPMDSPGRGGR